MTQGNVEIVRRLYEAIARHDNATVLAAYDRNVEFDFSGGPLGNLLGDTVYRGHEGLRSWTRDRSDDWEQVEDECRELIDAGQHVITFVVSRGRGRSSGAEVEMRHYGVWTIRDDKIIRVAWFYTREDALKAAGLSE